MKHYIDSVKDKAVSIKLKSKASNSVSPRRTLLKRTNKGAGRRNLDKNLFDSKGKNFDVYYWKCPHISRGIREKTLRKIDSLIYYKTSRLFCIG